MLNRSASLMMSTSVLKALPCNFDIKRHSRSINYVSNQKGKSISIQRANQLLEKIIHAYLLSRSLSIYHDCEGRIEKLVPWIAVWHHEACRVMTKCDPKDGFYYPTLT